MGFTTIVEINNDFWHDIETEPDRFVRKLGEYVCSGTNGDMGSSFAARVITVTHRDNLKLWEKFKKRMGWNIPPSKGI